MRAKSYSVTFVLPSPTIGYPPGGYNIVYKLAQGLNQNNIKTSIIFLSDPSIYVSNYIKDYNQSFKFRFLYVIFKYLFGRNRINLFYRFKFPKFVLGIDYDYSVLDNVDCYFYDTVESVKIKTDIIIATAWQTAYFVKEFTNHYSSKPLYLIQHSEDDPSFSGKNSVNAKKTYDFEFSKIVINKKLYNRFKDENPRFFHVGIDTNVFKIINRNDARESTILFPLRKNESKGAKYAIECAEKLINNTTKIQIIMFGDYKENEIPEEIRSNIVYYYKPTNKDLLKLYNDSAIFVLPSLVEGMALPPLEAMSCGCAVVVTDNGGTNEYIVDGFNGLVCPIKDSNCLSDKVVYLLNNKQKMLELIKNSAETARKYSYDEMINNFVSLMKEYIDT